MCAVFGLIDYNHTLNAKQREKVLRVLSQECEERGTDATGFAYNSRGKLTVFKRPFAAHNVHLKLREDANVIMGHTRMATQGNKLDNRNNHPFPGVVNGTHFALAHNGVLHNDLTLRAQMKLPNTPIKTDSYMLDYVRFLIFFVYHLLSIVCLPYISTFHIILLTICST